MNPETRIAAAVAGLLLFFAWAGWLGLLSAGAGAWVVTWIQEERASYGTLLHRLWPRERYTCCRGVRSRCYHHGVDL